MIRRRRVTAREAEAANLAPARQWVKVEFLAAPPAGKPLNRIDPLQVAATLGQAFGFEVITSLVVALAEPPARPPLAPFWSAATMHATVTPDGRLIEHPGPAATCLSDHCLTAKDFVL